MNFGTFVPTVLTAVGAHSGPAAIAANIAWRNGYRDFRPRDEDPSAVMVTCIIRFDGF
jgi:hypothetical protein